MAATIGALRLALGADTAAFSKGLKGADNSPRRQQRALPGYLLGFSCVHVPLHG